MIITDSEKTAATNPPFLTVPELAKLLHINEKKIYQLAGDGEIPGTKITGKWIFPRRLVEDWVMENSHGGVMTDRLILVGSDDRLIHQVCQRVAMDLQQSALISYSPCGTRHGLRMLDANRADACFINWGASETTARRHLGLLRTYRNHAHWVVIRCLERNQGLIVSRDIPKSDLTLSKLIKNPTLNWALRNGDSGSERLLADVCCIHDRRYEQLRAQNHCNNERSAVAMVNTGLADITCGVESTAREYQLRFVPVAAVSLDLVATRRTYFRTLLQQLLERLRDQEAQHYGSTLGGYFLPEQHNVVTVD